MALLPPMYLKSCVLLGLVKDGQPEVHWNASGFLYGILSGKKNEKGPLYEIFLVSNKHVFGLNRRIEIRLNPEGNETAKRFHVDLIDESKNTMWVGHPDKYVDVAVVPINASVLTTNQIDSVFFRDEIDAMGKAKAMRDGLSEGDGIFAMGFPLGLTGGPRNHVVVKSGCVAVLKQYLSGHGNRILLDCAIYPGNSGGPVVTKPESIAIQGTKAISTSYIIGIVAGYIPFTDTAVSLQTGKNRIMFEENSGLAIVFPVDSIRETIRLLRPTYTFAD